MLLIGEHLDIFAFLHNLHILQCGDSIDFFADEEFTSLALADWLQSRLPVWV